MGVQLRVRKISKGRISYYLDVIHQGRRWTETRTIISAAERQQVVFFNTLSRQLSRCSCVLIEDRVVTAPQQQLSMKSDTPLNAILDWRSHYQSCRIRKQIRGSPDPCNARRQQPLIS